MAETRVGMLIRDVTTIQWFDYTSPTALTYSPVAEGGFEWTEFAPEQVEMNDQNGAPLAYRDGAETGRSVITLTNLRVWDPGNNGSDVTLLDVLRQTGAVASWVGASGTGSGGRTIPTTAPGERKRFGFRITTQGRGGSLYGGTYTWDDVDSPPPETIKWDRGGVIIPSLKITSSQMRPYLVIND